MTEYGSLKPENFAGAKDMDTAIFQVTHLSHYTNINTNDLYLRLEKGKSKANELPSWNLIPAIMRMTSPSMRFIKSRL